MPCAFTIRRRPMYRASCHPRSASSGIWRLPRSCGRAISITWYCGDTSVKPLAASDDGVHTRLTFGAKADLPALFVRNEDGSESLLNFSLEGGDVVIHRVAPRFIVRRGKLTGCIVNKGFVGAGERLVSGTIAPTVTRDRKDERP